MARPAHNPDPTSRRLVEAMAGYGVPEPKIARVLRIDDMAGLCSARSVR